MVSKDLRELLAANTFTQKVIWAALTVAILMEFVLVYVLQAGNAAPSLIVDPLTRNGLYGTAAVLLVVSLIYRRHANSDARIERLLREQVDLNRLAMDPQNNRPDSERLRRLEALPPFEQKIYSLNSSLSTSLLSSLVLHQGVALPGFVLGFSERNVEPMMPFVVVAIVLNIMVFPKADSIVKRTQRWAHLADG